MRGGNKTKMAHRSQIGSEWVAKRKAKARASESWQVTLFMHNNNEYYTTSPKCNSV